VRVTDKEKAADWMRFVKASPPSYRLRAIEGVAMEGDAMLGEVLKLMKCERSVDLIKWARG
jgi:hypothetical protein